MDTLCGVHLESTWSPSGVHQDCIWSLPGVQTQYQEFTWTPDGVHQDPWGSVTYSFYPCMHQDNKCSPLPHPNLVPQTMDNFCAPLKCQLAYHSLPLQSFKL